MSARVLRVAFALLTGLALVIAEGESRAAAGEMPLLAPDFALKALDGHNYRLSEYRGEVVAVIFWASWCRGCRSELGRMQRLASMYRNAGLEVLGVTADEKVDPARAAAAAVGAVFPQLLDSNGSVGRVYRLQVLPATVLIDRSGVARFAHGKLDARGEHEMRGELHMLLNE